MRNVLLTGLPGSGKSTAGKYLAQLLDRDFLDLDAEIVRRTGKTIPELFGPGEENFRKAETAVLEALLEEGITDTVIACGGGVVVTPENKALLRKLGTVVYLRRSPGAICRSGDLEGRPLLAEGKEKIYDLYWQRMKLYETTANWTVDNEGTLKEVLVRLVRLCRREEETR